MPPSKPLLAFSKFVKKNIIGWQLPPVKSQRRLALSDQERSQLAELFHGSRPSDVVKTEKRLRSFIDEIIWNSIGYTWNSSQKNTAKIATHTVRDNPMSALALSCASSGIFREFAVEHIKSVDSALALSLLLRRLNDWVPEVRSAAAKTIEACVLDKTGSNPKIPHLILDCIDPLLMPEGMSRMGVWEVSVARRLINESGALELIREYIRNTPSDRAGAALKLALKQGLFEETLADFATNGRHPTVRSLALKTILEDSYTWKLEGVLKTSKYRTKPEKDEIFEAGLSDHSVNVQRIALQYVLNNPESRLNSENMFRGLINPQHFSLTDNAAFGLKRLRGQEDLLADAVSHMSNETPPPYWAARVTAKYGGSRLNHFIRDAYERLTIHPSVDWLELLAEVEDADAIGDLTEIALHHEQHTEARKAAKALRRLGSIVEAGELISVIERGKGEFSARGLPHLLYRCTALDLTRVILRLSQQEPEFDIERFWKVVSMKRQKQAFNPTKVQLRLLASELETAPELKSTVRLILGSVIDSF